MINWINRYKIWVEILFGIVSILITFGVISFSPEYDVVINSIFLIILFPSLLNMPREDDREDKPYYINAGEITINKKEGNVLLKPVYKNRKTNCINCGAPLTDGMCKYCGTEM